MGFSFSHQQVHRCLAGKFVVNMVLVYGLLVLPVSKHRRCAVYQVGNFEQHPLVVLLCSLEFFFEACVVVVVQIVKNLHLEGA